YLEQQLKQRFCGRSFFGDLRGRGLFWAIEFVVDGTSRRPFEADLKIADRVKEAALQFGVGIYSATGIVDGRTGDCAIIAPPYTITTQEVDLLVDRLSKAID